MASPCKEIMSCWFEGAFTLQTSGGSNSNWNATVKSQWPCGKPEKGTDRYLSISIHGLWIRTSYERGVSYLLRKQPYKVTQLCKMIWVTFHGILSVLLSSPIQYKPCFSCCIPVQDDCIKVTWLWASAKLHFAPRSVRNLKKECPTDSRVTWCDDTDAA